MINLNYLAVVVLYCIKRFKGERSLSAGYYLLSGKKSAQTTQDAAWYQLQPLYKSFPNLKEEHYFKIVRQLSEEQFVENKQKISQITEEGKAWLANILQKYPIPSYLNGWRFHQASDIFWKRLNLLIQTLSNWAHDESKFYPVERNLLVQEEIRSWLKKMVPRYGKKDISFHLYNELHKLLKSGEEFQLKPEVFAYKLTGYEMPGLTNQQLGMHLQGDEYYYQLCFLDCLHYMLSTIWNERSNYPLLASLCSDLQESYGLSKSSKISYSYLQQGKSLEEIAKIRRLKLNTVQDHIVEMALYLPEFPIHPYVPKELERKISETIKTSKLKKLRNIKELVPEADYFQIRLVLSKNANDR